MVGCGLGLVGNHGQENKTTITEELRGVSPSSRARLPVEKEGLAEGGREDLRGWAWLEEELGRPKGLEVCGLHVHAVFLQEALCKVHAGARRHAHARRRAHGWRQRGWRRVRVAAGRVVVYFCMVG